VASTQITLKEAGAFFGKLTDKRREAAMRGLKSAALRALQIVKAELIPAAVPQPVDRGVYRAGWAMAEVPNHGVLIVNAEPHAALVEHGVRAANVKVGRAMIAALTEWARRHSFEDPKGAAWAIARAMQKRGIWGGRGLGIKALMDDRLRNGIVEEEVKRELAVRGRPSR